MRIGILARKDISDKTVWSGTISFLAESIGKKHEIVPIIINKNFIEKMFCHLYQKFVYVFFHRKNYCVKLPEYLVARKVRKAIANKQFDLIFAPVVCGLVGKISDNSKVIYLSDATYHVMVNYYLMNESPIDQEIENRKEKLALERADAIIYSSEWAAKDAEEYYKISKDKIYVLPFGANLKDCYIKKNHNADNKLIKLLLVGIDWERKGIDLAIECVRNLNSRNMRWKFELTIIGFAHRDGYEPYIHFIGRLNKNNMDEYNRIIQYYMESDMFILPTKAECSAIVFSEASMYGLPVITHDTGGATTYVEDGNTGVCLQLGSTAENFADAILEILEQGKLQEYSRNAREKYEHELNWDAWLNAFDYIANKLVDIE